jgi:hypothetical protein
MPQLDISDVLLDPVIAGTRFQIIRRQETVDNYGRSQITKTYHWATGSVTPGGDNTLAREEAFQTQSNTISVTTAFRLRGPSKDLAARNHQPDVVVWNGSQYVVRTLNDFTGFGAGVVTAECVSMTIVDLPPE